MTLEKSMFDSRKVKPSESIAPARKFTKHEQSVKFKGNRKDADKHYKQMRFQCTSTLSYSYFHLLLLSATLSLSYSQSQLLLLWNYRMLSVKCVTGSKDLTATPKDKTITETKSFVSCKLTWIVLFFLVLLVFSSTCVVIEIEQWGEMLFSQGASRTLWKAC